MPLCAFCKEKAVFKNTDGKYLCGAHLSEYYENKVRETIEKYRMFDDAKRVCVGFSGGKDSTVLLEVLYRLNIDAEIIAVIVDEGIRGYRDDTIDAAEKTVKRLGIERKIISFADICGKTLDELLTPNPRQACSVCGTLRRQALNFGAKEVNADIIATGHCLDDEAQSVLMNYLRGDAARITESFNTDSSGLFLRRVKPLCRVTERETVAYGIVNNILTELPECPYTKYALRAGVRSRLGRIEYEAPGTMLKIADGQERMLSMYEWDSKTSVRKMGRCQRCGEPASGKLCAACTQLEKILKGS